MAILLEKKDFGPIVRYCVFGVHFASPRAKGSRGWPKGQGLKGPAQGPRAKAPRAKVPVGGLAGAPKINSYKVNNSA